jgi:hypothetical protein
MKHPITGEEMIAERWEGDAARDAERARKKAEAAAAVTGEGQCSSLPFRGEIRRLGSLLPSRS